jgi:glycosyltransferase involved in cell wall biosynthesis
LRIAWLVYGSLEQKTGGYIYDRLVVEGLRAAGESVALIDPRAPSVSLSGYDVLVGDALGVPELGPLFEGTPGPRRVLLVHHMPSWELEPVDRTVLGEIEARAVRASDVLVATGATSAARLGVEHPGHEVHVIVPGADRLPVLTQEPLTQAAALRLLFIGSLTARKRCEWLLDAMQSLPEGCAVLNLVGDASREPEHAELLLRRIADCPILSTRVHVSGLIDDRSLAVALSRADVLVLPSSLEGFGMVLIEALHAGIPVVASREAAQAAEISGEAAVFQFDGPEALGIAIERLATDRSALDRARKAALAWRGPRWSDTVASFRGCLSEGTDSRAPAPVTARSR